MVTGKVLRFQSTAQALLKATDTQASAVGLHSGLVPYRTSDSVYFRIVIDFHPVDFPLFSLLSLGRRYRRLQLGSIERARSSVETTINAKPTLWVGPRLPSGQCLSPLTAAGRSKHDRPLRNLSLTQSTGQSARQDFRYASKIR
jgi:hypothetical protein